MVWMNGLIQSLIRIFLSFVLASMPRSKSTPGLVESSGKVPLLAMVVARHHTLPANMLSSTSSRTNTESDTGRSSRSAHAPSRHSHSGSELSDSDNNALSQHDHKNSSDVTRMGTNATLTTSMTASSMTSYGTGTESSMPKSPLIYGEPDASRYVLSPPTSPKTDMKAPQATCVVTTNTLHPPFFDQSGTYLSPFPSTSQTPSPTPFSISRQTTTPCSPSLAATGASSTLPMSSSQTMFPFPQQGSNITNVASNSVGSLSRNPSQEILLQEISRLRERLVALETENTTMGIKLSQQQWEVEHRLAEIEMHICGSDSAHSNGSEDGGRVKSKESVI